VPTASPVPRVLMSEAAPIRHEQRTTCPAPCPAYVKFRLNSVAERHIPLDRQGVESRTRN